MLLFQELAVALDRADVVADQMVEARAGNVWRPSVDVVNKTVDLVRLELEFLEEMLGNLQECESIQLVACNVSAKARGRVGGSRLDFALIGRLANLQLRFVTNLTKFAIGQLEQGS